RAAGNPPTAPAPRRIIDRKVRLMHVSVDYDRCDSNGLCVFAAPEIFELDEEDVLHVRGGALPPGEWQAAEEAARSCPKLAITLSEAGLCPRQDRARRRAA